MTPVEEEELGEANKVAAREFFTSPYFAVTGASTNRDKFGYKIFRWYIQHGFEATPINPGADAVEVDGHPHNAISGLSDLSNPTETSLSVVTGPKVTLGILKTAKEMGIQRVWFQVGSHNDEVLEFARANFKVVVAGIPGSNSIPHGWCILVHGEAAASAAGRKFKL